MELTIIIIVGVIFAIVGFAAVVSVILGLPGAWFMIGLALLIQLVDSLWINSGVHTFGWSVLIATLALATIGEIMEFGAGALGAKKAGSTRQGTIGALIGGIVGAIGGIGIPIPVVGSLIGAVIGTFAGAMLGEATAREGRISRESLKPATGASIGRILGTLAKVPVAVVIWIALSVDAFWR